MPALLHKRLRLRLSSRTPGDPSAALVDALTRRPAAIWSGNALRIELGIDEPSAAAPRLVTSFAGWKEVVCELWNSQLDGTLLAPGKVVAAGGLNAGLTEAQWESGSSQHATIEYSTQELAFAFAQKQRTAWLSLVAVDLSDQRTTLGAGELTIVRDRALGGGMPPTPPALYLTAAQIYALLGNGTGGINVVSGNGTLAVGNVVWTWPVAPIGAGSGMSLTVTNGNALLTTAGQIFTWPVAEITYLPGAPLAQIVSGNLVITLGGRSYTNPAAPVP
jgi:hypothetical protein